MLVVRHEFQDKFSGNTIKVGTILEINDEERKKDLLNRQLIGEAEVLVLENTQEIKLDEQLENTQEIKLDEQLEDSELTIKQIKIMLDEKQIEYTPKDNKAKLLQLLKGDS